MKSIYYLMTAMSIMATGLEARAFAIENLNGTYTAEMTTLDLGAFGEASEDWNILDLSGHEVTVATDGATVTFDNFFPFEGGTVTGTFDAEANAIVIEPQTVLGDYTFCAYPTGDWWMDNRLTEAPQALTAKINDEGQITFDMWSLVKGEDVIATNYYATKLAKSSGTNAIDSKATGQTIVYDIHGRIVKVSDNGNVDYTSLPSGIYIINGKKIRL